MVIRSSASREVQQLLTDLRADDAVRRETAVARLRVLGSRAIARVETLLHSAIPVERALALRVLEGIDDPRVADLTLSALDDDADEVRLAAVATLRPWVTREAGTRVLDALVTRALDDAEDGRIRAAAREALSELPANVVEPVLAGASAALENPTPEEPKAVAAWLAHHQNAPLSVLHALVTRLKAGEMRETRDDNRREWQVARGAVHALLAHRGSAVALYDLRETFDGARAPLALDYLTAATAIGDAACVEALARAWSAAPAGETWWRDRVADAAAAIVSRLKLSARHATVKRVRARSPGFLK